MCTLILWARQWKSTPLLVAANRDERLVRPSAPPAIRTDRAVPILAPKDVELGGTWLGLNAEGVFAGITNRFGRPRDDARRSRGEVVLLALDARSAEDGFERTRRLDPAAYNAFHLLIADLETAHLVWSDGEALVSRTLDPGVHFITERSFGAAPTRREPKVEATIAELSRSAEPPSNEALAALLSEHEEPTLEGLCVHAGDLGYGTRSSTLVRIEKDGAVRFDHADGPPCRTPYREVRELPRVPARSAR